MTSSLTALAFDPGVLKTGIPSAVSSSTGMLFVPAPQRAMARVEGGTSETCAGVTSHSGVERSSHSVTHGGHLELVAAQEDGVGAVLVGTDIVGIDLQRRRSAQQAWE